MKSEKAKLLLDQTIEEMVNRNFTLDDALTFSFWLSEKIQSTAKAYESYTKQNTTLDKALAIRHEDDHKSDNTAF